MANITKRNNRKGTQPRQLIIHQKRQLPVNGVCKRKSLIYEATVASLTRHQETITYIVMYEGKFKGPYNNHDMSFKD